MSTLAWIAVVYCTVCWMAGIWALCYTLDDFRRAWIETGAVSAARTCVILMATTTLAPLWLPLAFFVRCEDEPG